MSPRTYVVLIAAGLALFFLTLLPQQLSQMFDRSGSRLNTAALWAVPRNGGITVTSGSDSETWKSVLRDDTANLWEIGAEFSTRSTGLWIPVIEIKQIEFTHRTSLEERGILPPPDQNQFREAVTEFVKRSPTEAVQQLGDNTTTASDVLSVLAGPVRRIIWPNVGLMVLQVVIVLTGLLVIWLGFRGLRAWHLAAHERCMNCGYSIVGLATAERCPECGVTLSGLIGVGPENSKPPVGMFPPLRHRRTALLLLGIALLVAAPLATRLGRAYSNGVMSRNGFTGLYAVVTPSGMQLVPRTDRPRPEIGVDVYSVNSSWQTHTTGLWLPLVEATSWRVSAELYSNTQYQPPIDQEALEHAVRKYATENASTAGHHFAEIGVPLDVMIASMSTTRKRTLWVPIGIMCAQVVSLVAGAILTILGLIGYRGWYLTAHQRCARCGAATVGLTEADLCNACGERWATRRY